jgi:hypothetical protein
MFMPFSISSYQPNAQLIPQFRRAYSGGLNGVPSVGTAAATDTPVLSVILNNVRSIAQGRPDVITTAARGTVQDALNALMRGRGWI